MGVYGGLCRFLKAFGRISVYGGIWGYVRVCSDTHGALPSHPSNIAERAAAPLDPLDRICEGVVFLDLLKYLVIWIEPSEVDYRFTTEISHRMHYK